MKQLIYPFSIIFFLFTFLGCEDKPSNSELEEYFQEYIKENREELPTNKDNILCVNVALNTIANQNYTYTMAEGLYKKVYQKCEKEGFKRKLFEFRDMRKTNGYKLDDIYHVEFKYQLHFLYSLENYLGKENIKKYKRKSYDDVSKILKTIFGKIPMEGLSNHVKKEASSSEGFIYDTLEEELLSEEIPQKYGEVESEDIKSGDILEFEDTVKFIKTENGNTINKY